MLPHQFVDKWSKVSLKERSAAQEHFLDLCRLVGHPTPAEADADGASFTFEKGAKKLDGSEDELQRRTLTNPYNTRPTWLAQARRLANGRA